MRVLLINKYFYVRGGAERWYFTVEHLLREAGHEVIHLSVDHPHNAPSEWRRHFLSAVSHGHPAWHPAAWRAGLRLLGGLGVRRAVRGLVDAATPDVAVIGNAYHQLGQPALLGELRRLGVPIVHMLHDYKIVCPAYTLAREGAICESCSHGRFYHAALNGCGGSRARGALLAAEARLVQPHWAQVDAFVAPSRFLIDKAAELGFPHPIKLLRLPVVMTREAVDPAAGTAVGYAGQLTTLKGVEVLLEAARQLPAVPFRLAGEGPLTAEISSRGLPNVTLLGYLDEAALKYEMQDWRIAVAPSIWYENCPYAVLEAFALGIPVVGSALGGLAELLEQRGVTVPPADPDALADAVQRLWNDSETCRRLGAAGRRFVVEECAPERVLGELQAMFEDIVP